MKAFMGEPPKKIIMRVGFLTLSPINPHKKATKFA